MRKLLTYLSVMVLVLSSSGISYGSSLFVGPSPRPTGMGSAYVAIAEGVSAVYWNPAGLAKLEGSGIELSSVFISAKSQSNTSLVNSAAPDNADGDFPYLLNVGAALGIDLEPSQYQRKDLKVTATLPFFGVYKKVNDITFAGAVYANGGGGGKWADTAIGALGDISRASIDASFGFMIGNISAAKEINQKLMLGVGLNVIYMMDKATIKKDFVSVSGIIPSYSASIDQSGTGYGIEGVIGGIYKAIPNKLDVGVILRSGSTIKLKGTAKYKQNGLSPFFDITNPVTYAFADANNETDYDQEYMYPLTYTIGFAYKPINPLILAFSIIQENYTVLRDDYDYEDETYFPDVKSDKKWNNSTLIGIGGEYQVNEKLTLRTGVLLDPNQCPTDKLTFLNPNQYKLTLPTLGFSYKVESYTFEGYYMPYLSEGPSKGTRTYEFPGGAFNIAAGYKF
ncbi:MAG: outer membrane protein transport protein [Endomicrobiales bacterium]|nr:outer membrane protein transport protein [Endomicrobiales bacterium]